MGSVTRQSLFELRSLAAALESLVSAFDSERPSVELVNQLIADIEEHITKLEETLQ